MKALRAILRWLRLAPRPMVRQLDPLDVDSYPGVRRLTADEAGGNAATKRGRRRGFMGVPVGASVLHSTTVRSGPSPALDEAANAAIYTRTSTGPTPERWAGAGPSELKTWPALQRWRRRRRRQGQPPKLDEFFSERASREPHCRSSDVGLSKATTRPRSHYCCRSRPDRHVTPSRTCSAYRVESLCQWINRVP